MLRFSHRVGCMVGQRKRGLKSPLFWYSGVKSGVNCCKKGKSSKIKASILSSKIKAFFYGAPIGIRTQGLPLRRGQFGSSCRSLQCLDFAGMLDFLEMQILQHPQIYPLPHATVGSEMGSGGVIRIKAFEVFGIIRIALCLALFRELGI